jgi:xanthine dehydrogenase YagR molybdenum-binding subunit
MRPAIDRARGSVAVAGAPDGRLTALIHEGAGETSRYEQFMEALTSASTYLYSCPNVRTRYRLVPLDSSTPTFMRAPGEASGIFALESAMDELGVALNMDPVELRLRNDTARDEQTGLPFSSRSLRACYELGAARFGWGRRNARPGSMRDGRLLVGWGVASATYPMLRYQAAARARLLPDGTAEVEAAASDMGPAGRTRR